MLPMATGLISTIISTIALLFSTIIRWPVTLGLPLHPEYKGTESNPGQGQVKYESIVAFTRPQTNTVTSEHSFAK